VGQARGRQAAGSAALSVGGAGVARWARARDSRSGERRLRASLQRGRVGRDAQLLRGRHRTTSARFAVSSTAGSAPSSWTSTTTGSSPPATPSVTASPATGWSTAGAGRSRAPERGAARPFAIPVTNPAVAINAAGRVVEVDGSGDGDLWFWTDSSGPGRRGGASPTPTRASTRACAFTRARRAPSRSATSRPSSSSHSAMTSPLSRGPAASPPPTIRPQAGAGTTARGSRP
jgi:hypothetical protein